MERHAAVTVPAFEFKFNLVVCPLPEGISDVSFFKIISMMCPAKYDSEEIIRIPPEHYDNTDSTDGIRVKLVMISAADMVS